MRMCWINDCNINVPDVPALCCFDCIDHDICPDRCHNRQPCNAVIEDYNDKNQSRTIKEESIIHR